MRHLLDSALECDFDLNVAEPFSSHLGGIAGVQLANTMAQLWSLFFFAKFIVKSEIRLLKLVLSKQRSVRPTERQSDRQESVENLKI